MLGKREGRGSFPDGMYNAKPADMIAMRDFAIQVAPYRQVSDL